MVFNLRIWFVGKNFFVDYFFMGGLKFDILQLEVYFFGENSDLNLLNFKFVMVSDVYKYLFLKENFFNGI